MFVIFSLRVDFAEGGKGAEVAAALACSRLYFGVCFGIRDGRRWLRHFWAFKHAPGLLLVVPGTGQCVSWTRPRGPPSACARVPV